MSTHILMFFQRNTKYSRWKYSCKPHGFIVGIRVEIHEFYHGIPVVKFDILLAMHLDIIA